LFPLSGYHHLDQRNSATSTLKSWLLAGKGESRCRNFV